MSGEAEEIINFLLSSLLPSFIFLSSSPLLLVFFLFFSLSLLTGATTRPLRDEACSYSSTRQKWYELFSTIPSPPLLLSHRLLLILMQIKKLVRRMWVADHKLTNRPRELRCGMLTIHPLPSLPLPPHLSLSPSLTYLVICRTASLSDHTSYRPLGEESCCYYLNELV